MADTPGFLALKAAERKTDAQDHRAFAVAAAIDLIAARAASAEGVNLRDEMHNLSDYADKIQAALKTK
ncbi:hypothetical protein V5F23_09770 [Pseudomonas sp. WP18]|uniref:hypothetical protein n=1 Tax=Pseudomonas sp. WP18 TaxID=3118752 RepID=UPI0030D27F5E